MSYNSSMTAKEAIDYVSKAFNITSKYALAKSLSDEHLVVQSIQISNYLNGRKMSKKVADRFFDVYGIVITDAHDRGILQKELKQREQNDY